MSSSPNGSWDSLFRIARLVQFVSELFRIRVDQAKREAELRARQFAVGAALAGVGIILLLFTLPILIVTVILVLTLWLPAWAATGIVAGAVLFIGGGFLLAARRKFAARRGEPIVEGLRDDWRVIREKMERHS